MMLFLNRTYFPEGTNGKLICEGKILCYTIELPWKNNEKKVSSIPEGKYFLQKRFSSKYKHHLEIVGVPQRSLILVHPANYALQELQDCIAPVSKICSAGVGNYSKKAFKVVLEKVNRAIEEGETVTLIVES
ncbi:DUF5675 family protein [Flavobacterium oreochromis]|uniref:DUF5675 family protein n=1 Tax=Flavobacterium oreochromis TaxID=2906078 RepID=A0ABW8PB11_9FLAO|nr:DUF5675 family protein [Flavobacterium oreochromis]OWP74387.1 hypothetical protein BWG23_14005 [Flavobacterium oreochromis]